MKHIYTTFSITVLAGALSFAQAQGIFMQPDPTDPNAPEVKLYVDISSPECACPNLADADPDLMPLYIWTWEPAEFRPTLNGLDVDNGAWADSNENMRLEQDEDNPNLWYFDFLGASLNEFYGTDTETTAATGISFLLKTKTGVQQTGDFNLPLTVLSTQALTASGPPTVQVYPNPAAEVIRIGFDSRSSGEDYLAEIYTADGRMAGVRHNFSSGSADLSVADLPEGLYIIRISTAQGLVATGKFLKVL